MIILSQIQGTCGHLSFISPSTLKKKESARVRHRLIALSCFMKGQFSIIPSRSRIQKTETRNTRKIEDYKFILFILRYE